MVELPEQQGLVDGQRPGTPTRRPAGPGPPTHGSTGSAARSCPTAPARPGRSGSSSVSPVVTSRRRAVNQCRPSPGHLEALRRPQPRHWWRVPLNDAPRRTARPPCGRWPRVGRQCAVAGQEVVHLRRPGALRGAPASITVTERRDRPSTTAALRPAAPPPMIITSSSMRSTLSRAGRISKDCCRNGKRRRAGRPLRDDRDLGLDAVRPEDP